LAQTTLNVPSQFSSIQAAISAAQPGDQVLVAPGTYNEQIRFLGKAIRVVSSAGADQTTIDAVGLNCTVGCNTTKESNSVALFVDGEGSGSVLEGFRLVRSGPTVEASGVWAPGASPLVEGCIIEGFESSFSVVAGAFSDGTFRDCIFRDNTGGALAGTVQVEGCLFERNVQFNNPGAAIYSATLSPSTISNSLFFENRVQGESHSGGAVAGAANVTGSLFVGNQVSGFDPFIAAGGGALSITGSVERCTFVGNQLVGFAIPSLFPNDGGAIRRASSVKNCIFRGNIPDQVSVTVQNPAPVTYSNVQGGFAGVGNFDLDPLFVNALAGDFGLSAGSPSIDSGDPTSPLDADGTRADQGAFPKLGALTTPDSFQLSLAQGGQRQLALDFGTAEAGRIYLLLGSLSGQAPGIVLDGQLLPLNPDAYTQALLALPAAPISGQSGVLDAQGRATALFSLPAGSVPSLAGVTAFHAALTLGVGPGQLFVAETSNALPLTLLP
jgi:hypothetical protein